MNIHGCDSLFSLLACFYGLKLFPALLLRIVVVLTNKYKVAVSFQCCGLHKQVKLELGLGSKLTEVSSSWISKEINLSFFTLFKIWTNNIRLYLTLLDFFCSLIEALTLDPPPSRMRRICHYWKSKVKACT